MLSRSFRGVAAAVLGTALWAAPAAAQDQTTEFPSWNIPGWTFTPGVVFGALYDSNVTLTSPGVGQEIPSDTLFQIEPFGQIDYFSPRTTLSGGYRGFLRRYVDLGALDSLDHRAFFTLRERVTRRLTVFVTENFAQVPTTDRLPLNGVPFLRGGARYNDLAGGLEARLSRSTDFTARYEVTWVDFMREDTPLTGGIVNGVRSSLSRRLTERVSLGGEYELRWADLNDGLRNQTFQDAGVVVRYRVGEVTNFEAAGGVAHLNDRTRGDSRTGPYVRAELIHRAPRATVGAEFRRSYVPSVAFGGTNQTETLRGYIQMPLARNRLYIQESASWHRSDPFDPAFLPLQSAWLNTVVGYAVQRWFRIEGYHALSRQDTRQAGGRIGRNIVGVQFVVSEPVRIR
ncbi:MAG TPA: hypothetical protein VFK57_01230 [Vicinamibacterales bacterium]|nr:hypothetical protein [Vicinamibacterales bacterium]